MISIADIAEGLWIGMIDREKVIAEYANFVSRYVSVCTSDDYEFEMHKAVLALLKEQKPKTVESIQLSRGIGCDLTGYCPSCHRPLKAQFNESFCGRCGQAVLWEGR